MHKAKSHFFIEKLINWLFVFFMSLIAVSCAKIVAPSGGPTDYTPPQVLKTEPVAKTIRFKENKIRIWFNEFVSLENQADQIVVSPPVEEPFEFAVRGKSVIVNLPEKLQDSTTYTIYFGESIQDITEQNPLKNYAFGFSTGEVFDSLVLKGSVVDAFSLQPVKNIFIMGYKNPDSAGLKSIPDFITRTDENGLFVFHNLPEKKLLLLALADQDNNLLYNLPNEQIGFCDTLKMTWMEPIATIGDSTDSVKQIPIAEVPVKMKVFVQTDTSQSLLKSRSDNYGQFKLIFKNKVNNPVLTPLDAAVSGDWRIDEWSPTKDTLTSWLINPEVENLKFTISDGSRFIDSVDLVMKSKPSAANKPRAGKGGADAEVDFTLKIRHNLSASGVLQYYKPMILTLNHPVKHFDKSKVILEKKKDSTYIKIPFTLETYSINPQRQFIVGHNFSKDSVYRIRFEKEAFQDIYGMSNDTIVLIFHTDKAEDYGKLIFTFKPKTISDSYIVELLTESNVVVKKKSTRGNEKITFENLLPGNYKIRIIVDANSNGKWDTGDFYKKVQPEIILQAPGTITIRANWDSDLEFKE
jgi:hypothetical protein